MSDILRVNVGKTPLVFIFRFCELHRMKPVVSFVRGEPVVHLAPLPRRVK